MSSNKGAGPGPSGQRPYFYKQLVGEKGAKPFLALLTGLSNILASGHAPPELRPYIGGSRCAALAKTGKDGTPDARPVCSAEVIRRVSGKGLLASEIDMLRSHVMPHQLAVGVRGAVEAMPHLVRQ